MESDKIIALLKSELAAENQEITSVIESQEWFVSYLEELKAEKPSEKDLIQEIADNFRKIMI